MSDEAYDFRKPGRLPEDVAHLLASWQRQMRSALELRWTRHLPFSFQFVVLPPSLRRAGELPSRYQQEIIIQRVDLGGGATALVIPRPVALALVSSMLGDVPEELPEDRVLTDIEKNLAELLMREVQSALEESQPLRRALTFAARGEHGFKEMHREFPEAEPAVVASLEMEFPFGKHTLDWILSQAATLEIAVGASEHDDMDQTTSELEEVVRSVPIEVVVQLGQTKLHVAALAELRVGDVVVLDQRLTDPMIAKVGGCPKFSGWPGRAGSKQAFQIESVTD